MKTSDAKDEFIIDRLFDYFLIQTVNFEISHEDYSKGRRVRMFERVKEWKSKYGYSFSIYSNDHLIDGKPHFHFDHKASSISCKIGFDGEIFDCKGKIQIPANVLKELHYFFYPSKKTHCCWLNYGT